jgi:phosphoserine phosphatase
MDSTMITVECIDELADYAGLKAQIAEVTERAMRGELDFAEALHGRVALLKGLAGSVIDQCRAERVRIMPGAKVLVRTLKARGAHTLLVSGGFVPFAAPVAAEIGFDRAVANVLHIDGGALAGTVGTPIVDAQRKKAELLGEAERLGLSPARTIAIGDGANDIPMIEAAGLGVAYHAKPKTREAAAAAISRGDLSVLLHALGIPRAQWVVE